jgi:hypothetical protein
MTRGAELAVVSSLPVIAWISQSGDAIVSLALGLAGVALARTVFVDRENRRIGRRQTFRETIPLTLIAMLVAGVIIWDGGLGYSKAAFTGLGVGWTAILILDVIGRRILGAVENQPPPNDMQEMLGALEQRVVAPPADKPDRFMDNFRGKKP